MSEWASNVENWMITGNSGIPKSTGCIGCDFKGFSRQKAIESLYETDNFSESYIHKGTF